MLRSLLKKPYQKLKKLKIICIIAFSGILFPAWGVENPMLVFVPKEKKIISFELPSNPATGYRWQVVQYDKTLLDYVKTEYQAKNPQLIGGGGVEKFYFKKKDNKTFKTQISLQYARSWEKKSVQTQIVKISIN